jgi:DNA-binding MarR family transcriptional regulator/catechol 2,3-dioxygenase-like lactoylglutathione lyase family enzyme
MPPKRAASDAALLRSAVSGLQRRLRAQDDNGEINPTGLGILGRLLRTGVANATEIAQLEHLQPQSLTRALKSLHDDGLIDRWIDEDDRRRTSLAITPKGEALLRETIRNRIAWLARVMESRLTPDERDTIRAAALLMERIAGGADAARPSDALFNLIPTTHVADVAESLRFYERLGFVEDGRYEHDGTLSWASMHARSVRAARIMFACADTPVDPDAQAVYFYCWSDDLTALHARLTEDGLEPSPIMHPPHMRDGEFHLKDPDGYQLIIGQPRRTR